MTSLTVEIELEEGDRFKMNDKWWTVEIVWGGLNAGQVDIKPDVGKRRCMDRGELNELISYSGEVRLVKSEYLDIHLGSENF